MKTSFQKGEKVFLNSFAVYKETILIDISYIIHVSVFWAASFRQLVLSIVAQVNNQVVGKCYLSGLGTDIFAVPALKADVCMHMQQLGSQQSTQGRGFSVSRVMLRNTFISCIPVYRWRYNGEKSLLIPVHSYMKKKPQMEDADVRISTGNAFSPSKKNINSMDS